MADRIAQYLKYHADSSKAWDIDIQVEAIQFLTQYHRLSVEQRLWLSFLFACTYCVPTAWYIFRAIPRWNAGTPEQVRGWWMREKAGLLFQTDRKWLKSRNLLPAVIEDYRAMVRRETAGNPVPTQMDALKHLMRGGRTPQERLDAIKRIANADAGGATLRLRPFIIGVSTPTYTELIRRGGEAGATALSTEFFCMDVRSKSLRARMPMFNKMCGFDLWAFYRKYSQHGGYMRLNRKVKEPFILKMKEACDKAGMRFYVIDAHFKELCANGSCCGLPPDWNYSRGQFCEALIIARKKGVVKWADISADVERLHGGYLWKHATGFNKQTSEITAKFSRMTMAEYLRWLWNSPSAGQSPYSMFGGIVKPDGKDADGNIIYKYTGVMTHLPSSPCQHCDK